MYNRIKIISGLFLLAAATTTGCFTEHDDELGKVDIELPDSKGLINGGPAGWSSTKKQCYSQCEKERLDCEQSKKDKPKVWGNVNCWRAKSSCQGRCDRYFPPAGRRRN